MYILLCPACFALFDMKIGQNIMDAPYLCEAEEQAGDCALLDVEGEQGVGHVDEEHGAPDPRVGRPRVRVQHYQHLSQQEPWELIIKSA